MQLLIAIAISAAVFFYINGCSSEAPEAVEAPEVQEVPEAGEELEAGDEAEEAKPEKEEGGDDE